MMLLVLRLTASSAVLACLCAAFAQGQELNVVKIVRDVAQKAEKAEHYSYEGDLLLMAQRDANPGKVLAQARIRCAAGPGGKSLLSVNVPDKGEYLLVSDGQKSWAYVPKLKQYTEEEASVRAGVQDDGEESGEPEEDENLTESFARQVIPILARMYKTAASTGTAGEAAVKFEKKKQKWPVLRVLSKTDAEQGSSMTELTIDPAPLHIGRLVWAKIAYAKNSKTVLRLTIDFHSFQIGEPLPDSTFTFEPPKNAKLADVLPIPGRSGSILLNHSAPVFELKTLDGERVRLDDLRGKPVLLTFFASWCAPCRQELPGVVKLHEEFKDRLLVLGVNDEGKGTARHFAEKVELSFPILDDSGEKAHRLYRVWSIPMTFLIDRDGKVVRFLSGSRDYESLRAALKAVGL